MNSYASATMYLQQVHIWYKFTSGAGSLNLISKIKYHSLIPLGKVVLRGSGRFGEPAYEEARG